MFGFLKSLKRLIDIVLNAIENFKEFKKKEEIRKASSESIEQRDQRPLEKIDGSTSRHSPRNIYKRMFVRKARKRK